MSEMVDRISAALREATGGNVHMHYEGVAQHILTAVRVPTDDMVERVARAIHAASAMVVGWDHLNNAERDSYRACAKAAIDEALK